MPCCQPTADIGASTLNRTSVVADAYTAGEHGSTKDNGGRSPGPVSLLEKYTFRETVRTVIEEDELPELSDFLESISLGDRLEVSSEIWLTRDRPASS